MSMIFDDDDGDAEAQVAQELSIGPRLVYSAAGENPDQGARAMQLSAATGVPAPAIFGNMEPFEAQTKAEMAAQLVRNSPELAAYVRQNMMAPVVSNDDYGNLSLFSDSAGKTAAWRRMLQVPQAAIGGALSGAAEGFGGQRLGSWIKDEDWANRPVGATGWALLGLPVEVLARGMGAIAGGITGGVEAGATKATGDEGVGRSLGREAGGVLESLMGHAGGLHPTAEGAAPGAMRLREGLERGRVWIENGLEPPAGLHPALDEIKAKANAGMVEALQQDMAAAQSSLTRERAPELFRQFAQQHYKDQSIGISAEAIQRLYPDPAKLPEAGDGLLGMVPGLADQLEAARTFGTDVHIPIADWITYIDPKVAKELGPEVRAWPGGITEIEAKLAEAAEPVSVVDSPLASVRAGAGLEPVFGIGDRKLTLEPEKHVLVPMEIEDAKLSGYNQRPNTQTYDIMKDGQSVGVADVTFNGTKAIINDIYGSGGLERNQFGPAVIRQLLAQLRQEHPEITSVEGNRVSGARFDGKHHIEAEGVGRKVGVELPQNFTVLGPDGKPNGILSTSSEGLKLDGPMANMADTIGPSSRADLARQAGQPNAPIKVSPIVALRQEAALIESELPPVADGSTRLWRGNRPDELGKNPQFTNDLPGIALPFSKSYKGPLSYVDVPTADLAKYVQEAGAATGAEFSLPVDLTAKAVKYEPKSTGESALQRQLDTLTAETLGLDQPAFKAMKSAIQARFEADVAAAERRTERRKRTELTRQWREDLNETRAKVEAELRQDPAIAADLLVSIGEINGERVQQRAVLSGEALTAEQRAALPAHYIGREGLDPTAVADLFGFPSVDALVEGLRRTVEAKGNRSTNEFIARFTREEATRRMDAAYNLEHNIMLEAKDQALSQVDMNLLAQEYYATAMKAGTKVLDKHIITELAEDTFGKMMLKDVSSDGLMAQLLRHWREAERANLAGDPAAALVAMQKRYLTGLLAKQARELEVARVELGETAAKFSNRQVGSVNQEFADHIQKLLQEGGYRISLKPEEIQRSIDFHGQGDLRQLVESATSDGWAPEVSAELQARGAKPVEQMTAAEFYEYKTAIDTLNHIGREIDKIEVVGEKRRFDEYKKEVLDNITSLPLRGRENQGRALYRLDASLTRMEEVARDLDLRQELGPLFNGVIVPMTLGKAKEFTLATELADHFTKTRGEFGKTWRKSLNDTISNDIIWDPASNALYDMTRENLVQVMLNWGNRSNIDKYVAGAFFGREGRRPTREERLAYEGEIKAFIDQHARPEDWKFVQRMWEPAKGWQKQSDVVARNTSGVPPKWIEPSTILTKFGEIEGGFWPVKYDRLGSSIAMVEARASEGGIGEGVFGQQYFRAATSKGHLKERTGYVDFVDISTSLEQAVGQMQQTMHDIAFREPLIQAAKIFYDRDIQNAVKKHYGIEYQEQMIPWLKRIAYQYSTDDVSVRFWNDLLRRTRTNLVGHVLPFNLNVILSPGVGVPNPAAWTRFLANRQFNIELAKEKSAEIKHLVYNLDRDYNDALAKLTEKDQMGATRRWALEKGYALTQVIEQQFRTSTFVDVYNHALAEGKTETQAIRVADYEVRSRHGAASVVDLPAAFNSSEGMKMLTLFQGYFNTMYNLQRQIPGNLRRGEWGNAAKNGFATWVVGSVFGGLLFNQGHKDESWFKTVGKAILAGSPMSTVPVLNQAVNFAMEGYSPRMPYASFLTAGWDVVKDVQKWMSRKPVEKPITHAANITGLVTGLPLSQFGRTAQFTSDVMRGKQRPKNIIEYARGIKSGKAELPR